MYSVAPVRAGPGAKRLYALLRSAVHAGATGARDRSDDMDRRNAHELTLRLSRALDGTGSSVETVQANPHAGGDAGYVTRVHRPDGTTVDVIGGEHSGYQITDRTLGWQPFDKLADELRETTPAPVSEQSPADDDDLLARLGALSVTARELGVALAAIRDELVLRGRRVTG